MRRGDEMYIVLYSPTGIHKVVEFLKTIYLVEGFHSCNCQAHRGGGPDRRAGSP